jgi:hypothetical protein
MDRDAARVAGKPSGETDSVNAHALRLKIRFRSSRRTRRISQERRLTRFPFRREKVVSQLFINNKQ